MAIASSNQIAPDAVTSPWRGFRTGLWQKEINVRDFIQQNYEPYEGDESFLESATERTRKIWDRLNELFVEERKKAFSTFLRYRVRSPPTVPVISIAKTKLLSVFKPKRLSSVQSCRTVAFGWL